MVADAINTFPRVDTVYNPTVVNGNLALNYCKGASPYSSNVVPTVGFPSRSNIIEWYWHEGREANCDTLAEKHYDRMNHELRERFDDTGQRDYCVRQTTPMGCHGPWLHVRVTVHENIEELPIADTTSICAGESTTIKVKNPNPQKYVLDLFDSEKNEINANGMILDTTEGKYFTSSGKNLYFARLKDPTTGCTSPLTGINAIVHPKPNLPSVIGDTTVYLCAGGEPFGLADRVRPAIHKDDQHTSVVWTAPNGSHTDTISTAKNTLAKYTIHQVDTLTQCAGDEIEITVKVEQTFRYTNFGERTLCHGESLLMRDAVGQLIHIDNNIIDSTSVGFKIFRLMDNARSTTEVGNDPVSSGKEEHLSDTTRYLIEVMDSVSGCFRQDTATLIFHELPHAKVVERLSQCQSVSLELPTPTDERYSYTWRDGNGNTINGIPAKLALESDERISLTETDKVFGCEKTFFVDVTVFPTPKSAKTADTSFCQNGTELRLKGETNGADDGFNTPGNLALQWFNERMDSIANTVKTDTIPVNGLIEEYRYTLRQTNTVTRCFKDTSITLSLRRNIRLAMADLKAVCEPETIDFAKEVNNYIHDNTEKINLVNAEGIRPTFAKTENGKTTVVSAEEATALAYADGKDKVDYLYAISDRDNVCTASDTVTVTIHRKPLSPVIENGLDSIFFCGNLEVVKIGAKDINPDTDETNIFWGEASSTIEGDSLNITSKEKRYTAFAKNILTGCVSEPDTIAAVISDPIKVSPIGENGKIELCAGERLDVANSAKSSFSIAQRWNSDITYTATVNGNTTNINALTDVSSMSQDTFVYEFTATDKLTGCEARNTLTLIFHDKPTFGIAGDTLLCQGEDLVLNTLGEERSTSYTWLFDGSDITESSSDKLVKKGLWQDTTVLVIAQLNGTSCTESQKQRILINETPAKLTDQSFVFCQTETNPSRSILLARTEEEKGRFDLQWHDSETNVVDNDDVLNISIAKDTAYTLSVRQVNNDRDANCQGELSTVSIRINKHIEVALRDTNICMPERFNLGKYAQEGKSESADGFNLKTDRILKGEGNTMTPVADSSQIEETGSYHIFYSDKNGCETTTKVKVEFISQPAAPTFDETMPIHLCQGIDTTVTPRFTAGNFEYIWEKTGAGETSVTDTLKIQASRSTEETVSYKVWRRDTLHGCESDKTDFSYQILDSIKTIHMEPIHLCESESVDLDSVAGQLFASANILEHKIYFSDPMQNKGGQLLYSNAVAEKGFYLVEAKDPVSGCNAKNLVEVQTHTNPTLLYKGDTSLCDRSDVNLTAYPKEGETTPAYQWTDAKGKSIQGNALSFTTKLEEGRTEARRDTLVLTGAYNITNQKSCVSRQTVEIITHPIPPTLENDTIDICQNPGSVKIKVDYQDNVFDLKRYDSDNNEITEISVGTENVTNERFSVAQEDRITKCRGKSADIFVNVRQGISLHIDEQEAICAPATVNLTDIVGKATRESNEEVAERKVFTTKSITLNGAEVNDPTAVGQSGLYRIVIEDQYGCQAGASIQLTVHQRPAPISGDTAFCQGTGMQKLAGAGTADGLTIEWLDLATAYPDSVYTDTLKVSTEREGEMFYLVRQTNAESQCSSESSPMSITIHPAIKATLMDTTICFGSSFDFMEYAQRHVGGGLNPYLKNARCADPVLPIDYNAIKQEGTFIALYTDAHQCEASDTMTLSRAPKIDLALEYTKEVCAGDTITVKAKGAQHYVWNGDSNDTDTFSATTSTEGTQEISLTASIVVNSDKGTSCSADTTIQVKVNKVPGLISGYGETAYCQNYPTEPLSLTPTDKEASVLWYDPNDGYSTVSKNGTLKPASLYAGDFVYKFRQQLGECQTTLQDYMVSIQSGIEETAVVNDTAYCKDETTAPLLAKWENPLYEVIWSNEEGEELTPGFRPSSSAAGQQLYSARLAYKACQGDASTLRISIQEKYDRKPDINDNFIFCEKTGKHTIKANGNDIGTRLNWYEENGNERLDSIVIDTDNPSWRNAKFFATQSVINGCESPSAPFEVSIKEAVQPQTILLDTCAGVTVTLGELMKMHDITDRADTLWMGADKSQRLDLNSKIDRSGEYLFSVVNPFGCKATHTARINMLKVEDLEYTTPKSIYCYDETVSLHASASNADIEWENITEGATHYGTSYEFALNGSANVAMTATISSKPACKDTVDFRFETYDMTVAVINGDTNACIGNTILLSTGNLYQTRWSVGDTTATSDDFSYTPSKSDFLTVEGFDKNQCPVKKTLTIKTAKQPDPTILVTPAIHSATYHLNRDTFEVHLEASLSSVLDENYSYKWDFGDGNTFYGGNTENHEYDASLVRLTKPIDVSLTVEHAYGCAGSATTRLLIDPDFDVPNTMTPEDVFMEDYELQIFDRIGNLVFEGRGWHGQTNNGEDAFGDTYFYAISYFVSGEKKIKTGYITLVR